MHPVLFSIGSIHGYSYGLMIGIGAILAILVSEWRANRRGMDGDLVFSAAIWGLVAGLVGAKLTFIISNFNLLFTNPRYVLGTDGFTVYGGIILGILVGAFILKRKNADIPVYLDLIIPQIALAQGFGRIGCFLAGCCYGKPTDSAIGVIFPEEAIAPSGVNLLPTQLFSAAGNFLIFTILILLSNFATDYLAVSKENSVARYGEGNKSFFQPWSISGIYLILYGIGRFIIEFFRADPRRALFGLTSNQYVSIVFFALGIFLIFYARKRALKREE